MQSETILAQIIQAKFFLMRSVKKKKIKIKIIIILNNNFYFFI